MSKRPYPGSGHSELCALRFGAHAECDCGASLGWTCPNCALDAPEPFCEECGRKLTRADLTQSNAPAAHMAASTTGASTKGE